MIHQLIYLTNGHFTPTQIIFYMIFMSHDDFSVRNLIIEADQSPKKLCVPLRYTDALVEPSSSSSLSVSLSYLSFFFFFGHTLSPNLFSICLSAFLHPSVCHPLSLYEWPFCVILCHFCFIFTPCVPFFSATIKPFDVFLKFPRPPPRSLPLFSICLSPRLLFPLPPSLFCSPAAHKNSSFLSPEVCSVA